MTIVRNIIDPVTGQAMFVCPSDPSSTPGLDAVLGSLANIAGSGSWYAKTGTAATNWTPFAAGTGSYLPLSGGTVTGNLTVNGTTTLSSVSSGAIVASGNVSGYDLTASRGTSGVIYLGNGGQHYLLFDGTSYQLPNGALAINGYAALTAQNYNSYVPSLAGVGANGTWGISITGNAATATSATFAAGATFSKALGSWDSGGSYTPIVPSTGARNVAQSPNAYQRGLHFEFKDATVLPGTGNYRGILTVAPYDGGSASGGEGNYQLGFMNAAANSISVPRLFIRAGIDTAWGSWSEFLNYANFQSFAPTVGVQFNGVTVPNGVSFYSKNTSGAVYSLLYFDSTNQIRVGDTTGNYQTHIHGSNVFFDYVGQAYFSGSISIGGNGSITSQTGYLLLGAQTYTYIRAAAGYGILIGDTNGVNVNIGSVGGQIGFNLGPSNGLVGSISPSTMSLIIPLSINVASGTAALSFGTSGNADIQLPNAGVLRVINYNYTYANFTLNQSGDGYFRGLLTVAGAMMPQSHIVMQAGMAIYHTLAGTGYDTASLMLRERGLGGSSAYEAPRLAFHWGGVVASQITVESTGRIAIRDNPGTGYENLIANNITAGTNMVAGGSMTTTAGDITSGANVKLASAGNYFANGRGHKLPAQIISTVAPTSSDLADDGTWWIRV